MIQIEPSRPQDAARLSEIAFAAKRHWGYPDRWMEIWRSALTIKRECIASHETYSAVIDGQVVAFNALGRKGDRLQLLNLWVLPDWIGLGIGRVLFNHALMRAKTLGFREIEIESDPNAEGFYLRMGARRVGVSIHVVEEKRRELPVLIYEIEHRSSK